MYVKTLELKTTDKCNYVIEISPNDTSIFFSLNEQGYILPKSQFLSLNEKELNKLNSEKIPIFNLEDTISNAKFSSDNKNIFISDQTKSIINYTLEADSIGEQNNKNNINIKNLKTWKFLLNWEKGIIELLMFRQIYQMIYLCSFMIKAQQVILIIKRKNY